MKGNFHFMFAHLIKIKMFILSFLKGHYKVVELLLEKDAYIDPKDRLKFTGLSYASFHGFIVS